MARLPHIGVLAAFLLAGGADRSVRRGSALALSVRRRRANGPEHARQQCKAIAALSHCCWVLSCRLRVQPV
jgi:hypothetical protein